MGSYEKGILGAFKGTVGPIVGVIWRGKYIMRSRPIKSNRPPTETQLLQRQRFATVTKFLTPIRGLYNRYYGHRSGTRSPYNQAVSYHIKEAIERVDDAFKIIYNKVMISKGDLHGIYNPSLAAVAEGQIEITWEDNSGQGLALPTDALLVVVYCEELNMFEVFEDAAIRSATEITLATTSYFAGLKVECWATFVSNERKLSASSSYLGSINLT